MGQDGIEPSPSGFSNQRYRPLKLLLPKYFNNTGIVKAEKI